MQGGEYKTRRRVVAGKWWLTLEHWGGNFSHVVGV
jgi:hypothetical protein